MSLSTDIRKLIDTVLDGVPVSDLHHPGYALADELRGLADAAEELENEFDRARSVTGDVEDALELAEGKRDDAYDLLREALDNVDGWRERAKALLG